MAQLKRAKYRVLIEDGSDDGVEHIVTVIHGDMIRGEAAARSRKIPSGGSEGAIERASLYVYFAMKRHGLTSETYDAWIDTVLASQPVEDEAGQPELVPVDPTTAPSDSR